MKRKDLLLIAFLLSQTAPVGAMDPPDLPKRPTISATCPVLNEDLNPLDQAQWFREAIQHMSSITELRADEHNLLAQKIILLGPSNSGKSTLLNYLAEKVFVANEDYTLEVLNPLEGSIPGHTPESQTIFPAPWKGPKNQTFWDCPGDNDTNGPAQIVVNEAGIRTLFKGPFKLLLTVSELLLDENGTEFLKFINRITNIFPKNQLEGSVVLVITKKGKIKGIPPHKRLEEILALNPHGLHNPKVRSLLQHLVTNKNTLIPYFPCPNDPGDYNLTEPRTKIFEAIDSIKFLENPAVHSQLPDASITLINNLGKNLNEEITTSLDNLRHKAIHLCKTQTIAYASPGNMQDLEMSLGAIRKALRLVENASDKSILDFTRPLDHFFDENNPIKEYVNTLMFLKTLKNDISYSKGDWAHTLQLTLNNMHELIDRLANKLCQKVTDSLEEINNSIRCKALPDPGNEERNIDVLQNTLGLINDVVARLQPDSPENIIHFATPLKTFITQSNPNPIENHMGVLEFLKTLKKVDYPLGMWTGPCNLTISHLQKTIETQKTIIALNQRIEEERRREEAARVEREEAARRAEEERQAHAAEIARVADRQRQLELAAERQHQAHEQLEQEIARHIAQTEADRIAAERQREADRIAAERQRQQREAEEARKVEETRIAKRKLEEEKEEERKKREAAEKKLAEKEAIIKALRQSEKPRIPPSTPPKPAVAAPRPQPKTGVAAHPKPKPAVAALRKIPITQEEYLQLKKRGGTKIEKVPNPNVKYFKHAGKDGKGSGPIDRDRYFDREAACKFPFATGPIDLYYKYE